MNRLRMSLTSKVLWIFVGALIVVGALAWGFSKPLRGPWRDQLPKVAWINLRAHLVSVADQIASSTNEAHKEKLLQDLHLELMVREGQNTVSQFGKDLPTWTDLENEIDEEEKRWAEKPNSLRSRLGDFVVGRVDRNADGRMFAGGRMFAVLTREGRSYAFFINERDGFYGGLRAFSGFAFTIAFLLIIILGITSWLVRPMNPLIQGVNAISEGRLDFRVPVSSKGEFGRLGEAFNKMAERIQEQLKAKDRLLMDVSHELRSPLGRIKMATEMLADEKLKPQLKSDIREMEDLITVLLDLYRHQGEVNVQKKSVAADALVRAAIGPIVENQPGVKYFIENGDVVLKIDEKAVIRALRNVVENAQKFSKHQTEPVEVRVQKVGETLQIDVKDYGIGMSQIEAEKVFEMFYRADSSRVRETGGYGLGLPLAKAILLAQRGDLYVLRAAPDQGCTFRFLFPMT